MKNLFITKWLSVATIMCVMSVVCSASTNKTIGYEYSGNIGPYKVVFRQEFFNILDTPSFSFCYRYLTKRVNKGNWIYCTRERQEDSYEIGYEWINEKHTGTFKIKIDTGKSIRGSFTNSKGEIFDVYARCTGHWDFDK